MTNILNLNINNDLLQLEFMEKQKIVIENFFKPEFAEKLYKFITKIPPHKWFYSCGIRNTRYEGRDIPSKKKKNLDNVKEANRSFSKDEFSFNLMRTMDYRKNEVSKYELLIRKVLSSKLFMSMISYLTNLNITNVNQLFLSKYKSGSFLSPHSDIGNGRLAFVINMTKNWKPQYGGILHFLNNSRTKIIDSLVPSFNNLVIFYIPKEGIPHFVSHVSPGVKANRFAITGWLS